MVELSQCVVFSTVPPTHPLLQQLSKMALKDKFPFIKDITGHADEIAGVHIENCIGFVRVPVGIADPLLVE